MKVEIHGGELNDQFPFQRIPEGVHVVPATVFPDDGEPYVAKWRVVLRDGTLYYSWPDLPTGLVIEKYRSEIG